MRQFLALDLPPDLHDALATIQAGLRPRLPDWRWVRPEGIHLTVRFLGEVGAEQDARCREAWRAVARAQFAPSFQLAGVGTFPSPRAPRVLWVGVDEPAASRGRLAALADALERAACEQGFDAEARPFRAHLTLARASREGRPVAPDHDVIAQSRTVDARELVLYESRLERGGARYTVLETFPFGEAR